MIEPWRPTDDELRVAILELPYYRRTVHAGLRAAHAIANTITSISLEAELLDPAPGTILRDTSYLRDEVDRLFAIACNRDPDAVLQLQLERLVRWSSRRR